MGTEMWKWGEGTGGRGDFAHNSQEVRGRYLCWENPVVWRQKIRPVHKETEVQRKKVMCSNSHHQLFSNEIPE